MPQHRSRTRAGPGPARERDPDRVALPQAVQAEAHDVVQEVVSPGEPREHRPHPRASRVVVREILVRHGGILGGAISRRRTAARAAHARPRARRGRSDGLSLHEDGRGRDREGGLSRPALRVPVHARAPRGGKRKPPDRTPVLEASWKDAIREAAGDNGPEHVAIGGKSMGGRIASMVADEAGVAGLVCFGYPFHPPGQPDKLRVAHLEESEDPGTDRPGRTRRFRVQRRDRALFTF